MATRCYQVLRWLPCRQRLQCSLLTIASRTYIEECESRAKVNVNLFAMKLSNLYGFISKMGYCFCRGDCDCVIVVVADAKSGSFTSTVVL